jgi:putative PIN family toxin of toxin-antitoxin system
MRVVLDTNVIVSAFISPTSPAAHILEAYQTGTFTLVVSSEILQEYEETLTYEKVRRYHKLDQSQIAKAVQDLAATASVVELIPLVAVISQDADDNALFACALAGHAQYIVSGDARVLAVEQYQGIHTLSPASFLVLVSQNT